MLRNLLNHITHPIARLLCQPTEYVVVDAKPDIIHVHPYPDQDPEYPDEDTCYKAYVCIEYRVDGHAHTDKKLIGDSCVSTAMARRFLDDWHGCNVDFHEPDISHYRYIVVDSQGKTVCRRRFWCRNRHYEPWQPMEQIMDYLYG